MIAQYRVTSSKLSEKLRLHNCNFIQYFDGVQFHLHFRSYRRELRRHGLFR